MQKKFKSESLYVSKADKGNTVVIMKRNEYDGKVLDFLNTNGGKQIQFNITKFSKGARKYIDMTNLLLDQREKCFLKAMNPVPPRLYGLPKLHKQGVSIRPVVSYISSPTYRLCKFLDNWFKKQTNFQPQFSVKNTLELVN